MASWENFSVNLSGDKLSNKFHGIDLEHWIALIMLKASFVDAPPLLESVCSDPDDDKFLALAIASNTKIITSGDKHLLDVSGYQGVSVLKPREFVENYISKSK